MPPAPSEGLTGVNERYKYSLRLTMFVDGARNPKRRGSEKMATKDIKTMSNEELGTEIMACKNAEKGLKSRIETLVEEAVARGFAGKNLPTVGGEYVIALSEDTQRALNMDKACDILGTEVVGNLLTMKQRKVKLAISDLGTSIDEETKNLICDIVEATVKATVRASKK